MDPDPKIIEIMVKAAYLDFDTMNPEQQAFARTSCAMMLYALDQAGYEVKQK